MRTSSFLACLILAACGSKSGDSGSVGAEQISCAVDGQAQFAPVCSVQQSTGELGTILTVSSPSGSFRRLLVARDGRGILAADGAEAATVTLLGEGLIEITLGADRYRMPATIKSFQGKAQ